MTPHHFVSLLVSSNKKINICHLHQVIDLLEIEHIRGLLLLRELNLQRNPLRELPDYRLAVLFHLQQLTELDRRKVDTEEKVGKL